MVILIITAQLSIIIMIRNWTGKELRIRITVIVIHHIPAPPPPLATTETMRKQSTIQGGNLPLEVWHMDQPPICWSDILSDCELWPLALKIVTSLVKHQPFDGIPSAGCYPCTMSRVRNMAVCRPWAVHIPFSPYWAASTTYCQSWVTTPGPFSSHLKLSREGTLRYWLVQCFFRYHQLWTIPYNCLTIICSLLYIPYSPL